MEKSTIITLAIASLLSIFISIGDLFFDFQSIPYLKETPQVTLLVVGILCLTTCIERITFFREVSNRIDSLKKSIDSALTAQFLASSHAAFNSIEESAKDAKQIVRVLFYSTPNEMKIRQSRWKKYSEIIENILKSQEDLQYRIVFGCIETEPDDRDKAWISSRIAYFQKVGLGNRIGYRYKQISVGFSLYSVDTEHLIIGFSKTGDCIVPKNHIKFTGKSQLTEKINSWYDDNVWGDACECNFTQHL